MMERLVMRREFANKWVDDLRPKIHKKLEKIKKLCGDYLVYSCGAGEFEARGIHGGQFIVNLINRSCSCRRWDLTGIPCVHVATVIFEDGGIPEQYMSDWYSKHTFLTSYSPIMHPMNGPGKAPIKPQHFTRQPGRPRKSRRREPDEPPKDPYRRRKIGVKMTCRRCGKQGHNSRTCKAPLDALPRVSRLPRENYNSAQHPVFNSDGSQLYAD